MGPTQNNNACDTPTVIQPEAAEHTIHTPALTWTDGHILGNGDLGAVVWGHSEELFIGFSKHDVNDLRSSGPNGAQWNTNYTEIVTRAMKGERHFWRQLKDKGPHSPKWPCPLPCGRLTLELLRGIQGVAYEQKLSMTKAECRAKITPTTAGWAWGMRFEPIEARVFVHADHNIAVIELNAQTEYRIRWRFDQNSDNDYPLPQYQQRNVTGLVSQQLPEGEAYGVCIGADAQAFECGASRDALCGTVEFGGAKGLARVFVAFATKRDAGGDNYTEAAEAILADAMRQNSTDLLEEHRTWWRDFWSKSSIEYEDKRIAQLWNMGVYALGASTRPDKSPPHLQGVWNQYDVPPWHGDFHFNTNIQECQWLACPSNHPELQAAMVRVLAQDWREQLRAHARDNFDAPGLAVARAIDWLGRPISGVIGGQEMSLTAWAAQHLWSQWRYTRDEQLLRDTVYPFLKECCEFYCHILNRRDDGLYHIEYSQAPEQIWWDENNERYGVSGSDPTIDIAFIRELFDAAAEASDILGEPGGLAEKYRDVSDHLPPLPTKDGVLIDLSVGFFHDGDRPGHFPVCHRHPSRLTPIHPCELIGLHSDDETLDLGRRSFNEFRSYGNDGITGWSEGWQVCIAARLGLGEDAENCLNNLRNHFLLKGLLTSHNSLTEDYGMANKSLFQIEALLGAAAGINEMLLQCTGGIIRVFPAVPEERSATFENLRAPGALLISARKEGKLVRFVNIYAECAGEVALVNPWLGAAVSLTDGDGKTETLTGDVIRRLASAGQQFRVEKA